MKIVAPKVGGAELADGSMLASDGQLAGTPSVLFDAVAVPLRRRRKGTVNGKRRNQFRSRCFQSSPGNRRQQSGAVLFKIANVGQDAGVVDANDKDRNYCCGKDTAMGPGMSGY